MRVAKVQRIGCLALALALAVTPVAFGADPPKGSHGQETDAPHAAFQAGDQRAPLTGHRIIAHARSSAFAGLGHEGSGLRRVESGYADYCGRGVASPMPEPRICYHIATQHPV